MGKAIDLKKRVSSYFRAPKNAPIRLQKLVEKTVDIEYTVVDSELEALILEANFIKSLRPRYNVMLRDDKGYAYLKITVNEEYPRVIITRKVKKDGAKYFGPRSSAGELRKVLDVLKKAFPYRHCSLFIQFKEKNEKNIADHEKRCFGTCSRSVSSKEYGKAIDQILQFFEGKNEEVEQSIQDEMALAVRDRKYEKAAVLRDRLSAIQGLLQTQRVSAPDSMNRDVIGLAIEGGAAYVTLFIFREGKLVNQEDFVLKAVDFESGAELEETEVLEAFIKQYYEKAADFPKEVLIPDKLGNGELLEEWVNSMGDHKVKFIFPKQGKNKKLIDLAHDNAKSFAKRSQVKWQAGQGQDVEAAMEGLKKKFKLPRLPRRIECYDISHLGGVDTVGSMVVFEKGFPKKSDYRHFKLRSVQEKIDDYQAMQEVLERRLKYLQMPSDYLRKPKKKELPAIEKILKAEKLDAEDLDQHKMLIAEKRKKIVGIARLKPVDKDSSEFASLWVHPKHRREGLARELLEALMAKQGRGKLYVMPCEKLVNWFLGLGFHEAKEIPKFFKSKAAKCKDSCMIDKPVLLIYRFQKGKADTSFTKKPNLLVIDGGKGQLSVAVKALKKMRLKIPVVALAKKEEEIFMPGKKASLLLPRDSDELQLLQRLRDEAHRFALKYQRNLRGKRMLS